MFRKKILTIITVVIFFIPSQLYAADKIFTSSGEINEGDFWTFIEIYNDGTVVDMYGGGADFIYTYDGSTLNVMGGTADVGALDYSTINITGGNIGAAYAWDNGTVNFYGSSSTKGLGASYSGRINMFSGTVESIGVGGMSITNLYGGQITDCLGAGQSSVVNVHGYGFDYNPSGGSYDGGQITGFWLDNVPFTIDLYGVATYAHINFIEGVLVDIGIHPRIVNLASNRNWLSARIELVSDCNAADVNSASVALEHQVPADWIWFNENQNVVMARFPFSDVKKILKPGEAELVVSGYFEDGTYFEGSDTIKVIQKAEKGD